jgi:uncharacterized membrane protein
MRTGTAALAAAVILTNVAGNAALSWGMKHAPASAGLLRPLIEPFVLLGIALLIAWTLTRLALLARADLSWVLPVTSVGYILSAAAGAWLYQEHVSGARWAGAALIVAGAALVGLERKETPA